MLLDHGKFGVPIPRVRTACRYGHPPDPICDELVLDHGQDLEQLFYGVSPAEYPLQDGLLVGVRLDLQGIPPGIFCLDGLSVSVSKIPAPG